MDFYQTNDDRNDTNIRAQNFVSQQKKKIVP
jgi:hypothetical protein